MAILNMGGSDDFEDEYADAYYSDEVFESDEVDAAPRGVKRLIAMGLGGILLVGGIAFGANAIIATGSGKLEFGQGITQNVQCAGSNTITVTPYAGFVNASGAGNFTLDSLYLEGIPASCNGKFFTFKIYSNSDSTPLVISETGTNGANYTTVSSVKFQYVDSNTATLNTPAFIDVETATDITADTTGSLQITFDADRIASFADAGQVYKITVESSGS